LFAVPPLIDANKCILSDFYNGKYPAEHFLSALRSGNMQAKTESFTNDSSLVFLMLAYLVFIIDILYFELYDVS